MTTEMLEPISSIIEQSDLSQIFTQTLDNYGTSYPYEEALRKQQVQKLRLEVPDENYDNYEHH